MEVILYKLVLQWRIFTLVFKWIKHYHQVFGWDDKDVVLEYNHDIPILTYQKKSIHYIRNKQITNFKASTVKLCCVVIFIVSTKDNSFWRKILQTAFM